MQTGDRECASWLLSELLTSVADVHLVLGAVGEAAGPGAAPGRAHLVLAAHERAVRPPGARHALALVVGDAGRFADHLLAAIAELQPPLAVHHVRDGAGDHAVLR